MVAVDVLRGSQLFCTLRDEELHRIAPLCLEERHEKGTCTFSKGDAADRLYLLLEGAAKVQQEIRPQPDTYQNTTISIDMPGDMIGWSALANPRRLTAIACCQTDVRLVAIEGWALNQLLEQDSHIRFVVAKELAGIIGQRLRQANEQVFERAVGSL